MTYATANDVRKLVGLPSKVDDPNYVTDDTIEYYLNLAAYQLLNSVTVLVRDEVLTGKIDGSNTEFTVAHYPIADQNFDSLVGTADVTVYTWTDLDDLDTKTQVNVSSVDWLDGRIVLETAPSTSIDGVTADYRYYLYEPDFNLFQLAEAYLAGALFFRAEYMEIPDMEKHGATTFRITNPATKAMKAYYDTLAVIRRNVITKGKMSKVNYRVYR